MLNLKVGYVKKIVESRSNACDLIIKIDDKLEKAIAYKIFVKDCKKGDKVLVNTTAIDLKLGTGGFHYVLANLTNPEKKSLENGHIMKLRYTPLQIKVDSCEEQNNKFHYIFNEFDSLNKLPIIIGGLHSMLSPLVSVLTEYDRNLRICYIMTDGGALPIDFSKLVYSLKKKNRIASTITVGHAFGGDLECVNIYNGLIAAKEIVRCDIAIVLMGPGIVGTGTEYGFSGIEQGNIIDAVNDLGGLPICVPRISFKDSRQRHYGISHHTITVLNKISKTRAKVGIPKFSKDKMMIVTKQIENYQINLKHDIEFMEFNDIIGILRKSDITMRTMGRGINEDLDFFITAGVNAKIAIDNLCYIS